jgi:signal transduction histidine kinase/HAMP domain-containing protein
MLPGSTSLRSKVAQRIFAVFLLCAILPFAGLVLLAYHQVATFFESKNSSQLRDLAKLFGMDVHERLTLLDMSLEIIASTIKSAEKLPNDDLLEHLSGQPQDHWDALFVNSRAGELSATAGTGALLPKLTLSANKHLDAGRAVLSVIPASNNSLPRIFLSRLIDSNKTGSNLLLTGEVKGSYLWGLKDSRLLPSHIEACVEDLDGVTLTCPSSDLSMLLGGFRKRFRDSAIGDFEWTENSRRFLASYWTVPMKHTFAVPGWVVLLRTSQEGAFASIKDLQTTFFLSIVVSVGLSVLLAIFQIRKRLTPVGQLQEGTQRIAKKDFGFRVQINSNDEFEELGASLNSMASQLGQQFKTITAAAEIDRAVLSLLDTTKVIETILSRISEVLHCDLAALTLFDFQGGQTRQWYLRWENPHGYHMSEEVWASGALQDKNPLAHAVAEGKSAVVANDLDLTPTVRDSAFRMEKEFNSCVGTPLVVGDKLTGVLSFYSKESGKFSPEEIDFVKGFANQAAVAIYNSQLYEHSTHQAAELLKANKAKDDFLAVISHELRTPLNVIMGYLALLRENLFDELTAKQSRAVEIIEKRSRALLAMINSIIEVTVIHAGKARVTRQSINPVSMLADLKSQVSEPAGKAIEIGWRYGTELPTLYSDGPKLKRILQILIDNAINFTVAGTVSISAKFFDDRKTVVFTVADTGIGIPEQARSQVFEIFHQVDYSATREHEGLGLGLYIAKQFADLIGAEITLESEINKGTIFTVAVPVDDGRTETMNLPETGV